MSTTAPREALIRMDPRRMRPMVSAFMMFSVDLPPGTCSVTTSDCSSSSFSEPAARALPSGSLASTSWNTTRMPRPSASVLICEPILP